MKIILAVASIIMGILISIPITMIINRANEVTYINLTTEDHKHYTLTTPYRTFNNLTFNQADSIILIELNR